jgi:hypothetical protein
MQQPDIKKTKSAIPLRKQKIHGAPWLVLSDEVALAFLERFGISVECHRDILPDRITSAFAKVPYENLTKILKKDSVISSASAMRYPDEVLSDFLKYGSGGTCFSLTAALVALLDSAGIDAYPILADRHYGVDTHCGVTITRTGNDMLLLDPGYLLFAPVAVPAVAPVFFDTCFNRIELRPIDGGSKIELYTIVKGNRKLRLTFRMKPADDAAFGAAWERSFAFEMMTYPVLTRTVNGCHQYLQGNVLAIRNAVRTERMALSQEKQIEFIASLAGINREIAVKALEIVNYGLNSSATRR